MDKELKRILNGLLDCYFKERSQGLLEWMRKLDNYLIEQVKPVTNGFWCGDCPHLEPYGKEMDLTARCKLLNIEELHFADWFIRECSSTEL